MKTLTTSQRYTSAFWNRMKNREADAADLRERSTYEGGYAFPSDDEAVLSAELARRNVFRQICTIVSTADPGTKVRTLSPAGDAAFVPVGAAIPESAATQTEFTVQSYKIAQIIRVGNDMLYDAGYDLRSALIMELGRMFAPVEEDACINGDGLTQPCGILHADYGAQTGVTVPSPNISFDDIAALYFPLKPEYRKNGSWLMNDNTAFALRKLKDSAGSPIWRQSDDTIFGMPVFISPHMPDITAGAKPVAFGDFSFYWLFERGSALIQTLREKYAIQSQTGFICMKHIDGRLVRQEAVKALVMA